MKNTTSNLNAERMRLQQQKAAKENWYLWGPYLAARAWGTVREDYSPYGSAWEHLDHNQSRARAYRWNEDGLGGMCDEQQRLCLAFALWNGKDPILKERAFGLTGNQGNRGEDVKEYYFYRDASPSHSYLHFLYKYPQAEYPYGRLVEENQRRGRQQSPFTLLDSGVFDSGYWDVNIFYAKENSEKIYARVCVHNRGSETATLHILPIAWFRNTWSWGNAESNKPQIKRIETPKGAAWAVKAEHETLGTWYVYGRQQGELLFTENESNAEQLWGQQNKSPYVKDAFHRRVIQDQLDAVNPAEVGTKFTAWQKVTIAPDQEAFIDIVLINKPAENPFSRAEKIISQRKSEADIFYDELLPSASPDDHRIMRQALSGMIWCKQFFHYDVLRWLKGDQLTPDKSRWWGRNHTWQHFKAADIISMPDNWEYPWFAAWDLAFHCAALALVDVDFAKQQIELMVNERYLHPNGQIPAYEWAFGDVNPPVHAMGALKVFRAERVQRGKGDLDFLARVFHKLLLNYSWWINRKDSDGHNVFEGGFLGLDNISVFDRSNNPLPAGYSLKQADATGWVAMFALDMTVMALELATEDPDYEDIAIQTFKQFLAIANTIRGHAEHGISLWDNDDGFFKDLIIGPDGQYHRINVYSFVGLIPLFATEVIDQRLLKNVPRFKAILTNYGGGLFHGNYICACPEHTNERGEHLLSLVDEQMLPRILERVLSENEFLSPYGVRSVSRIHAEHREVGILPGVGQAVIEYVPGESTSGLFGGNSNWRGPIWMPTNFLLIQAIEKFHRFLGNGFRMPVPCLGGQELNLKEISNLLAERLVDIYRRNAEGLIPGFAVDSPFQKDPNWKDHILFYEYFHGDTGQGLGAAHQTGWTGLLANLVMRRYRKDIPAFWREKQIKVAQPQAVEPIVREVEVTT